MTTSQGYVVRCPTTVTCPLWHVYWFIGLLVLCLNKKANANQKIFMGVQDYNIKLKIWKSARCFNPNKIWPMFLYGIVEEYTHLKLADNLRYSLGCYIVFISPSFIQVCLVEVEHLLCKRDLKWQQTYEQWQRFQRSYRQISYKSLSSFS